MTVGLRARKPICSGCGARGLAIKEHREKRWRHLDLGGGRCHIECLLRRLYCPGCGDVYERCPGPGPARRYTRDFEDVVAFLAQQMAKTPITKLMRIGWRSVGKILARVVADKLDRGRLDGLVMIGVDEVSYASEHRFLTCVADHQTGGVVWAAPGRNAQTLQGFFDELSDEQKLSITAVSIDMSAGYEKAIRAAVPDAAVAFDPFHVVQLGGKAADQVRRDEYNRHGRSSTGEGKWIKGARYSLLKDTANQTPKQLLKLAEVVTHQQADVPSVPAARRAALPLPTAQGGSRRAAQRVARVGVAIEAQTIREARPDHSKAQGRRARSDRARNQQRAPRSLEQPRAPDQPPRPRIPLSQRPDRDDLPLLRRHPNRRSLTDDSPPDRQESRF